MKRETIALGAAIRDARTARRLTQGEAALRGGMTQSEWSRIERGAADTLVLTFIRFARAIGITPGTLLSRAVRNMDADARPAEDEPPA